MNKVVIPSSHQEKVAVECKAVTKTFGVGNAAVHALRGIDLEVRTGELLMLDSGMHLAGLRPAR